MMIMSKCILCCGRFIALNISRNFQTGQLSPLNTSTSWAKHKMSPTERQLIKEAGIDVPEFRETIEDYDPQEETYEDTLYDDVLSKAKEDTKRTKKIIMRKKILPKQQEPNMLTWNERLHMKYLHESDPVEWSPERLSESFPALPETVRIILKGKWSPDSVERMKKKDEAVLQNWEKLKRNELNASPRFLKHLKKFTDRRDNLKLQLENPKFFYLPEIKKKPEWSCDGDMKSLLVKYERQIAELEKKQRLLAAEEKGKELAVSSKLKSADAIQKEIEEQREVQNITDEEDFLIGKGEKGKRQQSRKMVTLEELKKDILEKTEKKNCSLSVYEETILNKTLGSCEQSEKPKKIKLKTESVKKELGEEKQKRRERQRLAKTRPESDVKYDTQKTGGGKMEQVEMDGPEETEEDDFSLIPPADSNTKVFYESDMEKILSKLHGGGDKSAKAGQTAVEAGDRPSEKKEQKKKVNKPAETYGTEEDQQHFKAEEDALSGTFFWEGDVKKGRDKSKDAGFASVEDSHSPHLSPSIKTYFTYDYPEKIKIPKNLWEKGLTYRVKDCYYDDDGRFLYRVPGMSNE